MNFYLFSSRRESHFKLQKGDEVVEKHNYPTLVLVFFKRHNLRHRFLILQT